MQHPASFCRIRIIENLPGLTTILKASFAKDEIRSLAFLQDQWLQVIVHDVVNCFENVLSSPQYSSNMKVRAPHLLLVLKSGSEQIVQAPFPQKLSLRNEIPGSITGGVLPAPEQLLISSTAVMFIEVGFHLFHSPHVDALKCHWCSNFELAVHQFLIRKKN